MRVRETPYKCEKNATTSRCTCLCKQSSEGMGTCKPSSTNPPIDSYMYVYVMEALLEVFKRTPSEMYVCLCTRIKRVYECVCVCVSVVFTLQ